MAKRRTVEKVRLRVPRRNPRARHVANLMHVSKKQWAKWNELARHVFNATFQAMRDNQAIFSHPKAAHMGREKWRTVAWNAAWTAASEVRRRMIGAALVLLVLAIATPAAAQNLKCFGSFKVIANATYPADKPFALDGAGNAVAVYLKVETAGSGTVSVAANGYGPPVSRIDQSKTHRAQWLIGTLNAAVSAIDVDVKTSGVDFVVTGCTSCVAWLALCSALP